MGAEAIIAPLIGLAGSIIGSGGNSSGGQSTQVTPYPRSPEEDILHGEWMGMILGSGYGDVADIQSDIDSLIERRNTAQTNYENVGGSDEMGAGDPGYDRERAYWKGEVEKLDAKISIRQTDLAGAVDNIGDEIPGLKDMVKADVAFQQEASERAAGELGDITNKYTGTLDEALGGYNIEQRRPIGSTVSMGGGQKMPFMSGAEKQRLASSQNIFGATTATAGEKFGVGKDVIKANLANALQFTPYAGDRAAIDALGNIVNPIENRRFGLPSTTQSASLSNPPSLLEIINQGGQLSGGISDWLRAFTSQSETQPQAYDYNPADWAETDW